MGWAAQDKTVVEDAKVLVARTRAEAYKLRNKLLDIQHIEKGPVLLSLCKEVYDKLDEIDSQLNR